MESQKVNKGKVCGIIGGMSHESSDKISAILHKAANERFGGQSCADLIQRDVDFERITQKMKEGNWEYLTAEMVGHAKWMMSGGVDYVAIISNTMHRTAEAVEATIGEKHFLHIADCIARECRDWGNATQSFRGLGGVQKILLLGTRETMNGKFIIDRLDQQGLDVCVPRPEYHDRLNRIIFDELVHGNCSAGSRRDYYKMICNSLADVHGVDAIVLGCTELSMVIDPFELSHRKDIWEFNMTNPPATSIEPQRDGRPFLVIDSSQAQINCLKRVVRGHEPF